jgi:hypothetical protein
MDQERKRPVAKMIGANGNVFVLMGIASKALRENGQGDQADEMFKRITTSAHSYDQALGIMMEYVDIE